MNHRIRRTPEQQLAEVQEKSGSRKGLHELTLEMAIALDLDSRALRGLLDTFLLMITQSLQQGRDVMLPGFGSFRVVHRAARKVRNPRIASGPGLFKEVGASVTYRFKPGTDLKADYTEVNKMQSGPRIQRNDLNHTSRAPRIPLKTRDDQEVASRLQGHTKELAEARKTILKLRREQSELADSLERLAARMRQE